MQKSSKCTYKMGEVVKEKKRYLRPEDAIESAAKLNEDKTKLHIFAAYKCTTCHFFHVGRSHKINPRYASERHNH
jgi:hypothetical protein